MVDISISKDKIVNSLTIAEVVRVGIDSTNINFTIYVIQGETTTVTSGEEG